VKFSIFWLSVCRQPGGYDKSPSRPKKCLLDLHTLNSPYRAEKKRNLTQITLCPRRKPYRSINPATHFVGRGSSTEFDVGRGCAETTRSRKDHDAGNGRQVKEFAPRLASRAKSALRKII